MCAYLKNEKSGCQKISLRNLENRNWVDGVHMWMEWLTLARPQRRKCKGEKGWKKRKVMEYACM